jgi:hypothetical protein
MPMSPETAASPLAQAPADRPTVQLEDWARQGIALLFGDRKLDQNERRILRGFMEEVALRAQNGGIGNGGTPSAEMEQGVPPGPAEMNQNVEDMGTAPGAEPEPGYEGGY